MSEREPGSAHSTAPEGSGEHTSSSVPAGYITFQEIIASVAIPESLLGSIQAVAAVQGKTPNDVLRDALTNLIPEWVATPEFRLKAEAYLANNGGNPQKIVRKLGSTATAQVCGVDR